MASRRQAYPIGPLGLNAAIAHPSLELIEITLTLTATRRALGRGRSRHVGACQGIGPGRDLVERRFYLLLVALEVLGAYVARDVDRRPHGDADLREGKVDGHAAPGVRRPITGARDRKGNDRPPRATADHDDARTRLARRAGRHVRGQSDAETFPERGNQPVSRLRPAAIAAGAAPRRSGAANEFEAEAAKNAGEGFGVFVPRNDGATGNVARINRRQQKELSVPQTDDARMKLASPVFIVGGIGDNRRGVDAELDVVEGDGGEMA